MTIKGSDATRFQLTTSTQEQGSFADHVADFTSKTLRNEHLQIVNKVHLCALMGSELTSSMTCMACTYCVHLLHFNAIRYPVADMAINGRA
jgi:hypothetical protein